MRIPTLVLSLLAATGMSLVSPAGADPTVQCTPGVTLKLSFTPGREHMRFAGTFVPPPGFDPLTHGLGIRLAYEPETDDGGLILDASLPSNLFISKTTGIAYVDGMALIGGVKLVSIRHVPRYPDLRKIKINRRGAALPAWRDGVIRTVLTSGATCVRHCGSTCAAAGKGMKCQPSTDTALCGLMSGCEVLNVSEAQASQRTCLLPYPSDVFQAPDATTPTGKRHAYTRGAMPANASGVPIDPADYNTLDGFSPGGIIAAHWPQGVDLAASNVPPLTDFAASVSPASPTLLVEADAPGCQRVEHFGENDVSMGPAGTVAPPNQLFMIRPGRRLKNATRYLVALRGLVGQDGQPIQPTAAFQALRDGIPSGNAGVERRRPAIAAILAKLQADCGVDPAGVILAWDFTTASDDNLERWLLHMRNETLANLGSNAPAFTVTSVEPNPFTGDPRVCSRVRGTYEVPLYTDGDGPGVRLRIDPDTNLPVQGGVTNAPFTAIIPCSLVTPVPRPGRPIFYGHGLLGTGFGEVAADDLRTLADTYGFVIVATDWQGMASEDLATIMGFIGDLSGFAKLPERLHQGILNQLVLGHLVGAPDGLAAHPAFRFDDGTGNMVSVIDPTEVFFYGNSQGGILGGTVMALTTETRRGVLGVPAANFSTLLHRSREFEAYFLLLRGAYPDDVARAMTLPLIEELWQRAEPLGWYHHTVSNPLPGTPLHRVLVHMATNDAAVANIATEIMVRSMGVPHAAPVVRSYYGLLELPAPFDGSALVESDEGDPPAPLTNTPPAANNAHGAMRARPAILAQINDFLDSNGWVVNHCAGACNPE